MRHALYPQCTPCESSCRREPRKREQCQSIEGGHAHFRHLAPPTNRSDAALNQWWGRWLLLVASHLSRAFISFPLYLAPLTSPSLTNANSPFLLVSPSLSLAIFRPFSSCFSFSLVTSLLISYPPLSFQNNLIRITYFFIAEEISN